MVWVSTTPVNEALGAKLCLVGARCEGVEFQLGKGFEHFSHSNPKTNFDSNVSRDGASALGQKVHTAAPQVARRLQ